MSSNPFWFSIEFLQVLWYLCLTSQVIECKLAETKNSREIPPPPLDRFCQSRLGGYSIHGQQATFHGLHRLCVIGGLSIPRDPPTSSEEI